MQNPVRNPDRNHDAHRRLRPAGFGGLTPEPDNPRRACSLTSECPDLPLRGRRTGLSVPSGTVRREFRQFNEGMKMARYATAHLDLIDELDDAGARYRPIRHHLGISSFGATAWVAHRAGEVVINAHDEDDPSADEELFLVLRGHARFDIDGDQVDAPANTLVFAPPLTPRTATATEDDTTILVFEGTPGKAYEARGWEVWAPLAPRYAAGEYAEVADRLSAVMVATPQYPMLFFNLACCEAQCGRLTEALDHVRKAIDMSEEFRESAKTDPDLDPLRREPAFQRLLHH
jgi:mannose-6-phosphate isomerase-like protein (cupin superfamily)